MLFHPWLVWLNSTFCHKMQITTKGELHTFSALYIHNLQLLTWNWAVGKLEKGYAITYFITVFRGKNRIKQQEENVLFRSFRLMLSSVHSTNLNSNLNSYHLINPNRLVQILIPQTTISLKSQSSNLAISFIEAENINSSTDVLVTLN